MIDPSLRDARIRDEVADPTTAVVLFDVVLGYGSAADPTAGLLGVIGSAKAAAKAAGRTVAFIGYVLRDRQRPAGSRPDRGGPQIRRGTRWLPPTRRPPTGPRPSSPSATKRTKTRSGAARGLPIPMDCNDGRSTYSSNYLFRPEQNELACGGGRVARSRAGAFGM